MLKTFILFFKLESQKQANRLRIKYTCGLIVNISNFLVLLPSKRNSLSQSSTGKIGILIS